MNQADSIEARIDGLPIRFAPNTYALFMALWNARGAWVSKEGLYDAFLSADTAEPPMPNQVYVYLYWIRKKLERTDFRIVSHAKGMSMWRLERVAS